MTNTASPLPSYRHLVYALISIACPFIAFGIVELYHSYAYPDFGKPLSRPVDDADATAGAMMAIALFVEAVLAVVIGSVVGLVFAGLSVKNRPRLLSLGTAALLLNLIPVVAVIVIWFRGQ